MTGDQKRIFVLSPIGANDSVTRAMADKVLKHLIRKAFPDFLVARADADSNPGAITPSMVASILEADLIVADLSGANPNVFYEVAIAHGFRKPTLHIQKSSESLPFDVKDMRTVKYDITDPDDLEKSQRVLRDYGEFALAHAAELVTPLSSAEKFLSVTGSSDPVAESNVQVLATLAAIQSDIRAIRRRRVPTRTEVDDMSTRSQADRDSLAIILRRIVDDGRAQAIDFEEVITPDTSEGFDQWVTQVAQRVADAPPLEELEVLMHLNWNRRLDPEPPF